MRYGDLISVIVPVYNVEKYLKKCITSILNQTYSNLEIVIVNDGSTDNSTEIIEELKKTDSRISSYYQENAGLSAARNTGIDNSNGKYLVFVDSDDYIHPKMIEILYNNLTSTNSDIAVCDLHWINENESTNEHIENNITVYEGQEVLYKLILDDLISVVAWNKLYKRELFKTLRYPEGKLHEDQYIIHKILAQCNKSVYTTAKLYYYIKREGSIIGKVSRKKLMDSMCAFTERYYWSIARKDKKFTNWCFDALINEATCTIRSSEINGYTDLINWTKNSVKSALDATGLKSSITWRRLIIGYVWLKSPQLSAKTRWILHC